MREKRIAVVTHAFGACTFPVVKRLAMMGYKVDFYEICLNTITVFECFESDVVHTKKGIHEFNAEWYHGLKQYMGGARVNYYYVRTMRPFSRIPIVNNWASRRIKRQIKYLSGVLEARDYDCVLGVGAYNNDYYAYLYEYLKTPLVMILHEVVNHYSPTYNTPSRLMNYIFQQNRDFIVPSQNTKSQALQYSNACGSNIYVANLGLSEINRYIPNRHHYDDLKDFVLFFGSMLPYKGVGILYEAIVKHPDCLSGRKLVLAGHGGKEIMSKFIGLPNVKVINHYMPTSEMVEIIQNSYVQVMPYLTASQSGIPLAVYVFGKPIVATKIPSLMDYVKDEENGLLCNVNDADDLARQLKRITSDNLLYDKLCTNVMRFEQDYPEFSWDVSTRIIADVLEKNMKLRKE